MNELINRSANTGMAAVEETAEIAAVQAKMILARQFPRDREFALARILDECRSKELAERAVYEFPRGDSVVRGASIRLVECVARNWGNVVSGIKEIASDSQKATVKAYCWDLETNFYDEKVFDVPYVRNTKKGSYPLKDERDKYEVVANMATRRKRACMQAVIPQYIIDEAMKECQAVLEQNTVKDGDIETVKTKMLAGFKQLADWICEEDVERVCAKPFATLGAKDIVKLRSLYNAIKDGYVKPEAAFKREDKAAVASEADADALGEINAMLGGNCNGTNG